MPAALEDPFYYLANFRRVLDWLSARYADLLAPDEQAFIEGFVALPQPAQALLVRMIMRKGELFRESRLNYIEIGSTAEALQSLLTTGWVDDAPLLTLDELFRLFTLNELQRLFDAPRGLRKSELREQLAPQDRPGTLQQWWPLNEERVCALRLMPLCDRLRLMFFGNLRQDWSTFVLADLGIHRYETVTLDDAARGFRCRQDMDDYFNLFRCQEMLDTEGDLQRALAGLPATALDNPWIEVRRARLLFQLGQHCERSGDLPQALTLYQASSDPQARVREIRVLERDGDPQQALQRLQALDHHVLPAEQQQQLQRILPRLQRQIGLPVLPAPRIAQARIDLCLPRPAEPSSVEWVVLEHLSEAQAPVFYLENALLNSLFGLLCWEAIFAPLPGAFFHPFHAAPADLHASDFHARRAALFQRCLARLDDGSHRQAILATFAAKFGTLSPFVHWQALDAELLDLALACLPPAHLRACFERLLQDVRSNRAGMPDLIQFWPAERRYRMIEVKGPGDRLQDNQKRWLAFCAGQGIPVEVCYLRWADAPA